MTSTTKLVLVALMAAVCVLSVQATTLRGATTTEEQVSTEVAALDDFNWNGVWTSQGPCSHVTCCCFVKANTQVTPDNMQLNVTGTMEGIICPTFHHTFHISLDATFNADHSTATISALFGTYNIVISPEGPNAIFAKDPRSACDNKMVRGGADDDDIMAEEAKYGLKQE